MIVSKKDIPNFLDKLISEYQVFAPVKEETYTLFKQICSGADAALDAGNTKLPAKEIFFPQSEKLFSYNVSEEGARLEAPVDDQKKVIFGVRPCDAKSLTLLDNVFNNDKYQDPYYLTRRNNTIMIGIGCNSPASTCFCTSVNGGPFDTKGLDLLLVDTGDAYVVEVVSDKGREIAEKAGFAAAADANKDAAAKVKQDAVVTCQVNIDGLKAKLDVNFYDSIWEKIHEKCLGCGACTYLCPTCHCFDIVDEATDCNGCRVRNWDSCAFPLFTLHGSGHNPRTSNKERYRNRIMHKFKYFVDNFNEIACVGCGRCIKNCPVNMDIRVVLEDIRGSEARLDS
ncbi:4Fe-4S dicluster domain-containing protein [Desulfoscipio geothermicus]|uniref:4Fe-4S dicluster domain-containing protein n=1 Tax=Desulfoscipio geothermicus DSM 3669 TaxID=1121426 RepID=A0A1I6DMA5_9FIRM|nr:4Fe-4S dicluster domain-containing protein [Desulfoscipio geothermicus]SFR06633.1 4Fe-4S dicluster domain-containing protein [Desulfoscipio geothermicus DSM 3669]